MPPLMPKEADFANYKGAVCSELDGDYRVCKVMLTYDGDAMIAALPADGRLPGRFDANWQPTVKWSCLTGDCQLGINWGRLFQITGDARYRDATTRILGFVKKTQLLAAKEEAVIGGIKGSHPINGGYHPWQYPNWATKFYADALMMARTVAGSIFKRSAMRSASHLWFKCKLRMLSRLIVSEPLRFLTFLSFTLLLDSIAFSKF